MKENSWIERLKTRWQLRSAWQVVLVLIVFACTGFTVLLIKKPILEYFGGTGNRTVSILYWILIFPFYNLILLTYGFIFGQFNYFWEFEMRMFRRIGTFFGRLFGKRA